ncbi:MAG: hypothetical protein K9J38_13230 [Polynucleobacter sp.]|nr:hypothetical protein [Polynucleobacter sp.]
MSSIKRKTSFLRIFFLNILIFIAILFVVLSSIAIEARISNRTEYSHLKVSETEADCMQSLHSKLSLEQSRLLNRDPGEIKKYCASRALMTPEWLEARTYWDYHYYSSTELKTPSLNFNGIDQYNSRSVPCSLRKDGDQPKFIVWIFGGSTMQNMETSDELSIANQFCLNQTPKGSLQVSNFGVGSFQSELEIAKLLNIYKLTIRDKSQLPNLVIFYDGFNDSQRLMIGGSWAGLPPGVSNKISSLYTTQSSFDRAGYWLIRTISDWFTRLAGDKKNFISDGFRILIDKIEKHSSTNYLINTKVDWKEELDGKLLTSQAYIHDQKVLLGICESLNLRCVVILQPVLSLRNKPIGDIEQNNFEAQEESGSNFVTKRFYREVKSELIRIRSNNYKLIDLSDLPNRNEYAHLPFFYDFGHTGYYSGEILGREISNEIARMQILK